MEVGFSTPSDPHRIGGVPAFGALRSSDHLERRRSRELTAHSDQGRLLLRPEFRPGIDVFGDGCRVEVVDIADRNHRRHDAVADVAVGDCVHGHLREARVTDQGAFDGCGTDVLAVHSQPTGTASREVDVTVDVGVRQIATPVLAVAHSLGVGFRVLVVPGECAWAGDIDQFTSCLVGVGDPAVGIEDCRRAWRSGLGIEDLDAVREQSEGAGPGNRCRGDRNAALGGTEPVDDASVEAPDEGGDGGRRTLVAVHDLQGVVPLGRHLGGGSDEGQRLSDVVGVRDSVLVNVG